MNINEVPEEYKSYILVLNNKSEYVVTGLQKKAIMNTPNTFFEMADGSTINKSYIVEFKLNFQATKDKVQLNKGKIEKQMRLLTS